MLKSSHLVLLTPSINFMGCSAPGLDPPGLLPVTPVIGSSALDVLKTNSAHCTESVAAKFLTSVMYHLKYRKLHDATGAEVTGGTIGLAVVGEIVVGATVVGPACEGAIETGADVAGSDVAGAKVTGLPRIFPDTHGPYTLPADTQAVLPAPDDFNQHPPGSLNVQYWHAVTAVHAAQHWAGDVKEVVLPMSKPLSECAQALSAMTVVSDDLAREY
jgi:hypothetical protein